MVHEWNNTTEFHALRSRNGICLRRESFTLSPVDDDWFHTVQQVLGRLHNEQLFPGEPLAVREIHGKHPELSRRCLGQRNGYNITVHDFADVCRYGAQ